MASGSIGSRSSWVSGAGMRAVSSAVSGAGGHRQGRVQPAGERVAPGDAVGGAGQPGVEGERARPWSGTKYQKARTRSRAACRPTERGPALERLGGPPGFRRRRFVDRLGGGGAGGPGGRRPGRAGRPGCGSSGFGMGWPTSPPSVLHRGELPPDGDADRPRESPIRSPGEPYPGHVSGTSSIPRASADTKAQIGCGPAAAADTREWACRGDEPLGARSGRWPRGRSDGFA